VKWLSVSEQLAGQHSRVTLNDRSEMAYVEPNEKNRAGNRTYWRV